MSDLFDFSNVKPAEGSSYLKPGMYTLGIKEVKLDKPEGKTPALEMTFAGKAGMLKEKFYLTPKALGRLQYLHEQWTGKQLTKSFESLEQIEAYFKKLTEKPQEKVFIVGGTVSNKDGKVYANLPYTNFIVAKTDNIEEGEFEVGSARYNDVVKKASTSSAAMTSDAAILADSDSTPSNDEDTPW